MSESGRKKRAHAAVLRSCPWCIYCGGTTPATTVEHMPPRVMFRAKHRPKGLEFPACAACNNGSSHADLVAALFRRVYPDAPTEAEGEEYKRLLHAINNNIPGLLAEMQITEAEQAVHMAAIPPRYRAGGVLRVGGPLVTRYMQAFSLKLGLALHHEVTGEVLPKAGGIAARWFSNYERVTGVFPQSVFDVLFPAQTLTQGSFEVSDQFQYAWRLTEAPETAGVFLGTFGSGFAVLAFTATARETLERVKPAQAQVLSPGEIGQMLAGL